MDLVVVGIRGGLNSTRLSARLAQRGGYRRGRRGGNFPAADAGNFATDADELRTDVVTRDFYLDNGEFARVFSATNRIVKLSFRGNDGAFASADQYANFGVVPLRDDVETAGLNFSHRAVAVVIQDEDDRVQAEPDGGGNFRSGHLKRAVADDDVGPEPWVGHGDADTRGHGESHRHVVSGRDELRLFFAANSDGAEDRIADVGDDAGMFVEMERENPEDIDNRKTFAALALFQRRGKRRATAAAETLLRNRCVCEPVEEVAELDRFVAVITDVDAFGGGKNRPLPIELRGVKAHAHIGDEGAEHENEVGGFDVTAHLFVAAHRAAVNAEIKRMIFRDRTFTKEIG